MLESPNIVILNNGEKIRTHTNGYIRDWYGYEKTDKKLVCSKCKGLKESKGIAMLIGDNCTTNIYKCECGNVMASVIYGFIPKEELS